METEPVNNTHTYNGNATGNLTVTGLASLDTDYNEEISFTLKDDRSLTFSAEGESFTTEVAEDGSFAGIFTFNFQGICDVNVNVAGNVLGTKATGTLNGAQSCQGANAVLTGTFDATSATAPSFLDERPPAARPARVCPLDTTLGPVINLLLEE